MVQLPVINQALQDAHGCRLSINVEVATCGAASVRDAEAICAQRQVAARDPWADLVVDHGGPVGCRNVRAFGSSQLAGDEGVAVLLIRVQEVVLIGLNPIAAQLIP